MGFLTLFSTRSGGSRFAAFFGHGEDEDHEDLVRLDYMKMEDNEDKDGNKD